MNRTHCRVSAILGFACASALYGSAGSGQTPEQEKVWENEYAQKMAEQKASAERLAQQRNARKADPMAWVRTLDPLSAGGWTFKSVAPDGSWATFSTDHQLKRSGHLVTIWLRQEYPEAQKSSSGDIFLSNVEKLQFDCVKEKTRALLVIYYSENNLGGSQQSEEAEEKQAPWDPIVPGTQSESVFVSACGTTSAGTRSR